MMVVYLIHPILLLLKRDRKNLVRRKIQKQSNLLMINVAENLRKRISHAGYLEGKLNFQISLTWGTV
jgi:hypothetical protein